MQTNGYLLQDGATTLLIDAPAGVAQWLQQQDITPDYLLLTHQHFDHVEDAHKLSCPILAYSDFSRDLVMDQRAREWGLPVHVTEYSVSQTFQGEDSVTLGSLQLQLAHLPGHSPDSITFYLPEDQIAFVGDTLFAGGVVRTDLPQGDQKLLFDGIRQKLLTLPEATLLYPGHGPHTTPLQEKENPFLC